MMPNIHLRRAAFALAALLCPIWAGGAAADPRMAVLPHTELVEVTVHHRHHGHHAVTSRAAPVGQPDMARPTGGGEYGGVDQFGYPDNDPERPNGANNTVTARPGTDAYEEQENNRRYFCNFAPSRC